MYGHTHFILKQTKPNDNGLIFFEDVQVSSLILKYS